MSHHLRESLGQKTSVQCVMGLPLEVVLLIMEHARNDSVTLRVCCLLCRGCVDVCQRLLFEHACIILATADRALELRQLLDHKSALAPYITALHVDANVSSALHFLHGRLPELRTITAKDCHPRSMISWTTMDPDALAAFVLSCPSLQELRLDGIQLERALFNADPQAIEVPVRKLATAHTRAQLSPLRGLTKELAFPRLHTAHLTLCSALDSDEAAIGKLLRDCPSMRVLCVDLPESCSSNVNLGIHANLTRLVLTVTANEVQYRLSWGAREYILPSHLTSRLTTVMLSFENLSAVHDMHRLLGLLGDMDRESVLTVAWNGAPLCHGAYSRDVLNDQVVRAALL